MKESRASISKQGIPSLDPGSPGLSAATFPDGAQYRIEIPSTEGPNAFRAVLEAADALGVPVHRVSQGSGIMLLADEEIAEMHDLGASRGIEVNLFVGPRATFDIGAQAYSAAGRSLGLSLRGADQLVYAVEDVRRAVRLGIRSVLVSDIGLLAILGRMKREGDVPGDLILKTSVMMAPANPAIRQAIDVPIDLYVEAPDNIGGFIRYYEVPEFIRVAAPLYVKLGLRNAPDIYPSGSHIESTAVSLSRERVRRARIVLDMIDRYGPDLRTSPPGGARA